MKVRSLAGCFSRHPLVLLQPWAPAWKQLTELFLDSEQNQAKQSKPLSLLTTKQRHDVSGCIALSPDAEHVKPFWFKPFSSQLPLPHILAGASVVGDGAHPGPGVHGRGAGLLPPAGLLAAVCRIPALRRQRGRGGAAPAWWVLWVLGS